jgi:preprotein translocase subunit SecY
VTRGAIQGSILTALTVMVTLTAGTMFLLWLGEQITEKGIGNGISQLIFVGIMVSIPNQVIQTAKLVAADPSAAHDLRRGGHPGPVPRLGGRRHLHDAGRSQDPRPPHEEDRRQPDEPVRLDVPAAEGQHRGVIPVIFAMSIQLFPATIAQFFPPGSSKFGDWARGDHWLQPGQSVWASLLFAGLVLFFTYFYTAIQYDTTDIADNLKKYGSFIPGVKPGKPTAEYLDKVLTRITLAGAIFLAVIALVQYWAPQLTGINTVVAGRAARRS